MITRLELKNFKCFKEVDISFSKITLLTGENSSGKSSLIYGLLAPLQSTDFPLYLFPNGKYVNMGDFEEMSFKNSKNNKIEINIDFWPDSYSIGKISTTWIVDSINKLPKLYQSKVDIIWGHGGIENFIITLDNDHYKYTDGEKEYKINYLHAFYPYDRYVGFFCELDQELNFIGSYRFHPERTYYQKPKSEHKILGSGEGYIDQILEWQEQEHDEFNDLISILKDLKLLYNIKFDKIGGGRFDLRVKVKSKSNWASLADVGFGISQLLPIIVADLQLSNSSTLIMAQPEIHLHPSIQAELGTYLVKQATEKGKRYIVETHSEYLLNRLRLCIVKGEIEPEDVAVYYFENTIAHGSIKYQIEFTKDGQILNAPKGFFDTYMIDTMDIALNA